VYHHPGKRRIITMKKLKKTVKKKSAPKKKVAKTKKKVAPTKVAKKKYKSYYKPKKKVIESAPVTPPVSPAEVKAKSNPISSISKTSMSKDVPTPSKRPVKYLNNRDLLAQVLLSKGQGKMTNELAKMLQLLTSRYAKKGNFANYTYNDDMQSYAMLMIVKTWNGFDPAKSSNPFAWFTQCIKNSFIQYLNYEKRQRDVRDEILVDKGMAPSFGFTYDYEEKQREADVADQEVMEAPTKLHEDVDSFDSEPDTRDDEPGSESNH
jgi:hypothetical protein